MEIPYKFAHAAMLALRSTRYQEDSEYRQAVDSVLAYTKREDSLRGAIKHSIEEEGDRD